MKLLLSAFEKFASPEQQEMQSLIYKHGGVNYVRNNDKVLKQLLQESSHLVEKGEETLRPSQSAAVSSAAPGGGQTGSSGGGSNNNNKTLTVEAIRTELSENLDSVLDRNFEIFNRKFEIQKRQISEEIAKVVNREGDRIIEAVTTGPHDRILDPDMHYIWKEMVSCFLPSFSISG
jgi:hypothetical protein